MFKYKTILIDDEQLALERLQRIIKPFTDSIEVIDIAMSGEEAIMKINQLKPELIFLDIQMPEINGFEVLKAISHIPYVIFSTAYDHYALKAFETNSIDYLLKPVTHERLKDAIEKLKRLTHQGEFQQKVSKLLSNLDNSKVKRLQVRIGDTVRFIDVDEIFFFIADEKYVELYTFDKKYLLTSSLTALEKSLPEIFVRIHRSTIVNMDYVEEAVKMSNSLYEVRMKDKNKTKLAVSRKLKINLGL